jgi:hypothetical protein
MPTETCNGTLTPSQPGTRSVTTFIPKDSSSASTCLLARRHARCETRPTGQHPLNRHRHRHLKPNLTVTVTVTVTLQVSHRVGIIQAQGTDPAPCHADDVTGQPQGGDHTGTRHKTLPGLRPKGLTTSSTTVCVQSHTTRTDPAHHAFCHCTDDVTGTTVCVQSRTTRTDTTSGARFRQKFTLEDAIGSHA